jgi:hypothetical protein
MTLTYPRHASEMYEAVVQLLHSANISKSAFQHVPVATLAQICNTYQLPVEGTGRRPSGSKKKSDYIEAIFSFVSQEN